MNTTTALDVDDDGEPVDQKEYRSMIGSLLYLMLTRPNIQFSVCLCACFQTPWRTSHRQAVKRTLGIFDTLLSSIFGIQCPLLFRFLGFRMPTLWGVDLIGSRLQGHASFWVALLFLGLLANNLV
jgi:hypothetical protein